MEDDQHGESNIEDLRNPTNLQSPKRFLQVQCRHCNWIWHCTTTGERIMHTAQKNCDCLYSTPLALNSERARYDCDGSHEGFCVRIVAEYSCVSEYKHNKTSAICPQSTMQHKDPSQHSNCGQSFGQANLGDRQYQKAAQTATPNVVTAISSNGYSQDDVPSAVPHPSPTKVNKP